MAQKFSTSGAQTAGVLLQTIPEAQQIVIAKELNARLRSQFDDAAASVAIELVAGRDDATLQDDLLDVLKIRIETASAKTRAGGPGDEKSDLQNAELSGKTWTGVVPTYQMMGQPMEDANNKVKVLPEYLADWVADANSMAEQRAVDSVEG